MHPGPVNRGVELAAEVIDSPQALIVEQVESGVVVRMAVLYELLAGGGGGGPTRRPGARSARPRSPSPRERRGTAPPGARARRVRSWHLLVRGARLLDPRSGLDRAGDVLVRGGRVAEIGEPGAIEPPDGAEQVRRRGACTAFPGFVDPHVHLRTPGREDEEDLDTGTHAAAAGGYCAILAMPNTDPVVDSRLGAAARCASAPATEARIPTGFTAAITRGQGGEELTEMAELADAGAFALHRRRPAGALGRRHAPGAAVPAAGRPARWRCTRRTPRCRGGGVMHEGEVSAALGLAGHPSVSESTMVARDVRSPRYEGGRIHVQHVSARESVEAIERGAGRRACRSPPRPRRTTCCSPRRRALAGHPLQDEPAAALRGRPPGADRRPALGRPSTAWPPTTRPHSREEKEQPFELAPMGVTGLETRLRRAAHRAGGARRARPRRCWWSG